MKYIIIFSLFFLLFSCEKIKPEVSNKNKEFVYHVGGEACGIATCNLKSYLNEQKELGKFNLPDLEKYRNTFSNLLIKYKTKDKLIASQEFQDFATQINIDFFNCEGNLYKCNSEKKYSEYEINYLFYIFIPEMVVDEFVLKKGGDEAEAETIIQAIKRKDFVPNIAKEIKVNEYEEFIKDFVENTFNELDLSNFDINSNDFKEKLLGNDGIYNKVFQEIYKIKIDWEEGEQLNEIVDFTINSFFSKFSEIGLTEEKFEELVRQKYGYLEGNISENIVSDFNKINIGNVNFDNLPKDRYYRNDELYKFSDEFLDNSLNETFLNNNGYSEILLSIKSKVLLLYFFGKNEELYSLPNMIKMMNTENNFIITNSFKISKYIKIDSTLKP